MFIFCLNFNNMDNILLENLFFDNFPLKVTMYSYTKFVLILYNM